MPPAKKAASQSTDSDAKKGKSAEEAPSSLDATALAEAAVSIPKVKSEKKKGEAKEN